MNAPNEAAVPSDSDSVAGTVPPTVPGVLVQAAGWLSGTIGTCVGDIARQLRTCAWVWSQPTITSMAFGSRVSLSCAGVSFQTPAPPPKRYSLIQPKPSGGL